MKIVTFLLCLTLAASGYAQKLPEIGMTVRITEPDKTIVAEVRPTNSDIKTKPDHIYYWYGSGKIQRTQGGYSGKALNGTYQEYYLNKNLKTQGSFKEGSKTGVWKTWTEAGILTNTVSYKKGVRSGAFSDLDAAGLPAKKGNYRNDQLNGKLYTYRGDSVSVTTYKDGKPLPPSEHVPIWKKIRLFKKKAEKDTLAVKGKH